MKKTKLDKLALHRETLKQLDAQQLAVAAGARPTTTNIPTMSTCTCVTCLFTCADPLPTTTC